MDVLPKDVLLSVFEKAAAGLGPFKTLVTLAHCSSVCREWRDVLLGTGGDGLWLGVLLEWYGVSLREHLPAAARSLEPADAARVLAAAAACARRMDAASAPPRGPARAPAELYWEDGGFMDTYPARDVKGWVRELDAAVAHHQGSPHAKYGCTGGAYRMRLTMHGSHARLVYTNRVAAQFAAQGTEAPPAPPEGFAGVVTAASGDPVPVSRWCWLRCGTPSEPKAAAEKPGCGCLPFARAGGGGAEEAGGGERFEFRIGLGEEEPSALAAHLREHMQNREGYAGVLPPLHGAGNCVYEQVSTSVGACVYVRAFGRAELYDYSDYDSW